MRKKRVLLIGTEPQRMIRLRRTYDTLRDLDVEVSVFTPYDVPRGKPRLLKGIVRYLLVTLQIALSKADIYHFYNVPDIVGLPLILKRGTLVYDVRSPWYSSLLETLGNRVLSIIAEKIEWFLTRTADVILTSNTPLAKRAKKWGGRKVILVPNYPPIDFAPNPGYEKLKSTLHLEGHPIVLFLGKISILEGSELIQDIILKTCKELPSVRFLIVGEGPQSKSLIQFIDKKGLSQNVVMVGWVPHIEVPDYISIADLCLFPRKHTTSSPYTSPESILKAGEYLALGKPIIAPKMGAFADLEFPVISVEPSEMADAVIDFLQNPIPVPKGQKSTWQISHEKLKSLYKLLGAIE